MSYSFTQEIQETQVRQSFGAPSPKQLTFYQDLCKRKRVEPQPTSGLSQRQLGMLIEELQKKADPASETQLKKIAELHAEILEMGGDIKPIPQAFLDSLSGGREGTASQVIQKLYDRRAKLVDNAPPTEEQTKRLVSWFFCPDVPFESLTIARAEGSRVIELNRRVYLEPLQAWSSDVHNADTLAQRPWRMVTPEEFANEIKAKLTRQDASYVIEQFSGKVYDWKNSRITKQQIRAIRELETRMSTTYTQNRVEIAITEDGEFIELNTPSRQRRASVGFNPISEEALIQMSVEDASRFIDQLRSERDRPELRVISGGMDESQQLLTDKHALYNERTGAGQARDAVVANAKEVRATEDIIYALESINGYQADELHDLINENAVSFGANGIRSEELAERMKVMMTDSIDLKSSLSNIFRDISRLTSICEDSAYATKLAQEVAKEVLASIEL